MECLHLSDVENGSAHQEYVAPFEGSSTVISYLMLTVPWLKCVECIHPSDGENDSAHQERVAPFEGSSFKSMWSLSIRQMLRTALHIKGNYRDLCQYCMFSGFSIF